MYRLHSTAVNKSQWNSAPSTQWRGERMWIIGETSPSSNVSSLGSSLARAALHRKSLPTSCICAGLMKFLRVDQLASSSNSAFPSSRREGRPAEANCSCLRSCDFDTKHVVSNESIVPSQGKPTTATWSPNHVSQQVRIALSDSQGWLTPEQKMLRNSSGRCTSKLLQTLWSGIFWYDFCTMVESDLLPALLKSCL